MIPTRYTCLRNTKASASLHNHLQKCVSFRVTGQLLYAFSLFITASSAHAQIQMCHCSLNPYTLRICFGDKSKHLLSLSGFDFLRKNILPIQHYTHQSALSTCFPSMHCISRFHLVFILSFPSLLCFTSSVRCSGISVILQTGDVGDQRSAACVPYLNRSFLLRCRLQLLALQLVHGYTMNTSTPQRQKD